MNTPNPRIGNPRIGNAVVGIALLGIVAYFAVGTGSPRSAGLTLEPAHLEVNDLVEGESREVNFWLHNDGASARHVMVKTSCACSTALTKSLDLLPGARISVPIRVDTRISPGGNTAAIQIQEGDAIVAQSMLTFRSTPELIADPSILSALPLGKVTTSELFNVGVRRLEDLEVVWGEGSLDVRIAESASRRWRLEVRRKPIQRTTTGEVTLTVRERESGNVLVQIPVAVPNLADAELRVASAPEVHDDGTQGLWVLLEDFVGNGPEILEARCGNAVLAHTVEPVTTDATARWIRLDYAADLAGAVATLHCRTAGETRQADLQLL